MMTEAGESTDKQHTGESESSNKSKFPIENPHSVSAVDDPILIGYYSRLLEINNIEEQKTYTKSNVGAFAFVREYPITNYFRAPWRNKNKNREIAADVLERLMLRHSILKNLEGIENQYYAAEKFRHRQEITKKKDDTKNPITSEKDDTKSPTAKTDAQTDVSDVKVNTYDDKRCNSNAQNKEEIESEGAIRTYRLATTDLFVEKAIAYLEEDYRNYIIGGVVLFLISFVSILYGAYCAQTILFEQPDISKHFRNLLSPGALLWHSLLANFIKSFTFYGFIVLFAVFCLRLGKAMIDQAERLRERRHSLRQGRLYIHLSNGEVTVEELEKAFDWNVSKGNAFANIPTEASAPWGAVIKEALKVLPDVAAKFRAAGK